MISSRIQNTSLRQSWQFADRLDIGYEKKEDSRQIWNKPGGASKTKDH